MTNKSHRRFLWQFDQEFKKNAPQPERLALYIAGMEHPEIDINAYMTQIDEIAAYIDDALSDSARGLTRAEQFLYIFNHELGFTGNKKQYFSADNSFLNKVLEQRTGLPIMLSLVCIAIGRRIRIDIEGMGFPAHFMVRYQDEEGSWILDPFNGVVMSHREVETYIESLLQKPIRLHRNYFKPIQPNILAQRILNNLRMVYLNDKDYLKAVDVLDYLLLIEPTYPPFWQERGLLNSHSDEWEAAYRDIRRYFFLTGQLGVALDWYIPDKRLSNETRQMLNIFEQIEQMRLMIN
ncbi:MAG: transglutaminase-like domain-containing protein [Chloroflexota bacterium]